MAHDLILKPDVDENGLSEPVNVFLKSGEITVAYCNAKTKLWYSLEDPTGFSKDVMYWSYIDFPKSWDYDEKFYGGAE